MTVKAKSNTEIVQGAIDLLERDGWIQGAYHSPKGHCLVGALEQAGAPETQWSIYAILMDKLVEAYGGGPCLSYFNDSRLKSKDDAVAVLEKARAALEENALINTEEGELGALA